MRGFSRNAKRPFIAANHSEQYSPMSTCEPLATLCSQKLWNSAIHVACPWRPNGWMYWSPMRAQFSNQMPTLNVAAHSVMKLRSSMPNNLWKATMGGTVDSPTPMVPISSDSTSVMSSNLPKCVDSVIAAIQPEVPPPAMTTFFTAPGTVSAFSIKPPSKPDHRGGCG